MIYVAYIPASFATISSITIDNDSFTGTDRGYTSGVQFTYSAHVVDDNYLHYSPLTWLTDSASNINKWSFDFGQKMWTPTYLSPSVPIPGERPYAGLLYFQLGHISISETATHSVNVLAGVTGPNSFTQSAQEFLHSIIGSQVPQGWDYQIKETPVLNLSYEGNYPFYHSSVSKGRTTELSVPTRVMVGGYRSEVATGLLWRWGENLQDSRGSAVTSNEMSLRTPLIQGKTTGAFIFAGAETRYRFNDITIDGERPQEVYPTDVEPVQATAVLGGVMYNNSIGASLTFAIQTKEFKQDRHNTSANGSLSIFRLF